MLPGASGISATDGLVLSFMLPCPASLSLLPRNYLFGERRASLKPAGERRWASDHPAGCHARGRRAPSRHFQSARHPASVDKAYGSIETLELEFNRIARVLLSFARAWPMWMQMASRMAAKIGDRRDSC